MSDTNASDNSESQFEIVSAVEGAIMDAPGKAAKAFAKTQQAASQAIGSTLLRLPFVPEAGRLPATGRPRQPCGR